MSTPTLHYLFVLSERDVHYFRRDDAFRHEVMKEARRCSTRSGLPVAFMIRQPDGSDLFLGTLRDEAPDER